MTMAETEPVAEQQQERSNEPIVYDESLLIIVKGKVQQPKQPDHTESRLFVQKLQAEITKRGDRIKEIKGIEEQLRSNAKGVSSGNKDVLGKLKELRDQRGNIIRQKAAIRDELSNCDGAREAIRTEMRSIRDKNRNVNPEKIEQDIRDLEFKLTHETLPEQEEKRVQALLQQLTAARPLAKKYAEYDARIKEGEILRASIIARLKESDGVIAQLDTEIAAASGVLDEARAKADAQYADLPALQVEKKENYEIMVTLRAKIDEIRKQNDQEYQDFIKRDRAYKGWKREQGRKKYEERQKEREERDRLRQDENKAILGDIVVEPYSQEIFTCDQLLTYLRSFTAVKEEVKEEVKTVEVPAGLKPFKRQEVVDEMFTGVPKKAPQGKGGKAAPAPVKAAEPAKPKVQKLNHMLDMLKVFLQLQVEPPTTTSGIPATIERVEARKAEYKVKQEEAKLAPPPKPAANGSHKTEGKEVEVDDDEPAAAAADEEPEASAAAETAAEPAAAPEPKEQETAAPAAKEAPAAAPEEEEEEEETAASSSPVEEAAKVEASSSEPGAAAAAEPAASKEEAAAAPAESGEAEAEEAAAEGDGVDVTLKVDGNSVSLSVKAAA